MYLNILRGIINSYGHNWTKENMFDNLKLRVGAGSELVVDLVTQGGSVVDEAPELFRNVHVSNSESFDLWDWIGLVALLQGSYRYSSIGRNIFH